MSKKGSKNDAKNRGKGAEVKMYNGKPVKPLLYCGRGVGHGNYMAACYEDGKLAYDKENKPVAYSALLS